MLTIPASDEVALKCPACLAAGVSLGSRILSRFGQRTVCGNCGRRLRAEKRSLSVIMYMVLSGVFVPLALLLLPYVGCVGLVMLPVILGVIGEVILGIVCPLEDRS